MKKLFNFTSISVYLAFALCAVACGGNNQKKSSTDETELPAYNSPDLAFHDLYGDVKSCSWDTDEWYTNSTTYRFDKDGNWTNIPDFLDYEKESWSELAERSKYERDKEGYIVTVWVTSDMDGVLRTNYKWDNQRISTIEGDEWLGVTSFDYDEKGVMTAEKIKRSGELEGGEIFEIEIYKYSDHQFDEHNNWVRRKVTRLTQTHDAWGAANGETEGTSQEKSYYETRKIKYYTTEEPEIPEITQETKTAIYNQMKDVLHTIENDGWGYYFLSDFDDDELPELWIVAGTCVADSKIYVYSIDKSSNQLSKKTTDYEGAYNCSYYIGDRYIIECYGKQGYGSWQKLTISNDKIESETIFEENLFETGAEDYSKPEESPVTQCYLTDLSLLNNYE